MVERNNSVPVCFSKKFHDKINWLVKNYPLEIAGFITGSWEDWGIYIDDLLIFKQEVTSGNVTKQEIADILLINEYGVETTNKIIGEWHSHNTMTSFWSSTDEEFIKTFLTNNDGQDIRDFCLCVVSSYGENRPEKCDHLVRLDINGVKGLRTTLDKINYYVEGYKDENLDKLNEEKVKLLQETNEKVKPYKELIDKIVKESSKKINDINDKLNNILVEKENEVGKFLEKEIENKVEEKTYTRGIEVKNYSKLPKSFRPDIDDDEELLDFDLDKETDRIKNTYLKFKGREAIMVEDIPDIWANQLENMVEEEDLLAHIKIDSELLDNGNLNLLFHNFQGKKKFKRTRDILIENLIMLEEEQRESMTEEDDYSDWLSTNGYQSKLNNTFDYLGSEREW